MMTPDLLTVALLLSTRLYLTLGRAVSPEEEVSSESGLDCSLQCTAQAKPGVQYVAVRWYKLKDHPSPRQSGLLTRNLPNGTAKLYTGVDREVTFVGESHDVFLPNVTCSDSGVYMCYLAAPVGEQNREGMIFLTLKDCPAEPMQFPAGPTESPVHPADNTLTDTKLVIFASTVLMVALVIFFMSYCCLKNSLREKSRTPQREILLNASLKPLEKKDLMLIYTLGPKPATMKHVCV